MLLAACMLGLHCATLGPLRLQAGGRGGRLHRRRGGRRRSGGGSAGAGHGRAGRGRCWRRRQPGRHDAADAAVAHGAGEAAGLAGVAVRWLLLRRGAWRRGATSPALRRPASPFAAVPVGYSCTPVHRAIGLLPPLATQALLRNPELMRTMLSSNPQAGACAWGAACSLQDAPSCLAVPSHGPLEPIPAAAAL